MSNSESAGGQDWRVRAAKPKNALQKQVLGGSSIHGVRYTRLCGCTWIGEVRTGRKSAHERVCVLSENSVQRHKR